MSLPLHRAPNLHQLGLSHLMSVPLHRAPNLHRLGPSHLASGLLSLRFEVPSTLTPLRSRPTWCRCLDIERRTYAETSVFSTLPSFPYEIHHTRYIKCWFTHLILKLVSFWNISPQIVWNISPQIMHGNISWNIWGWIVSWNISLIL